MQSHLGYRLRPSRQENTPSVQLPCKRLAFVYQRLSTTEQKKNSRYSLERQDDLAQLAREHGYPEELVVVERRDLGISGTKGQDEREGLAHLIQLIEQEQVESVYVIEISRISRDQTLITGLQFGELCKQHDVIIVTPMMRFNLRDEMHMRMYRYEIDRAAEELKSIRYRMHGAKLAQAKHGYYGGSSIPPGYVRDNQVTLPDGTPNPYYLKYRIYEEHAQIVRQIFLELAKPGAYFKGIVLALKKHGIAFPPLPDDLKQIKGNNTSFLRSQPNADGSYPITLGRLKSIVSNPAYIGWYVWGGQVMNKNNHPPIIDEETFWTVQKKFNRHAYNRTQEFQPLPFSGLLYCGHHNPPRRLIASNAVKAKERGYHCWNDAEEKSCFNITARVFDIALSELVIRQCSFPQYADQVIQRLTDEYQHEKSKAAAHKREHQRIMIEIDNLKANLARTRTPEQVDMLLDMIDAKVKETEKMSRADGHPIGRALSSTEIKTVRSFLKNLDSGWTKMSDEVKHNFLTLLIERVDFVYTYAEILARVTWRTRLQQAILIERPFADRCRRWTEEENKLLREFYPTSSLWEIAARLPHRSIHALRKQAQILGIAKSEDFELRKQICGPMSQDEEQILRDYASMKISRSELYEKLNYRTHDSIQFHMRRLGLPMRRKGIKWDLVEIPEGELTREVLINKSYLKIKLSMSRASAARSHSPPIFNSLAR